MKVTRPYHFQEGEILLIDKPVEWTSFDVVNKIRRSITRKIGVKKLKVGHAGTLDPLATGLLILCTGKFTKSINELQLLEKEYTGTFCLGATTPSLDKETEIDKRYPTDHISPEMIHNTVNTFIGEIDQVPPIFSAIKVDGTRAYQHARKNDTIKLKPRKVNIFEFETTNIRIPEVDFRVSCSKGTYIRSLARDFGEAMQSGAYLCNLRRTKVGKYSVIDAITIDEFLSGLESQFSEKS